MAGQRSNWPLPERFRLPWRSCSLLTLATVHVSMKLLLRLQRVQVKNLERLKKVVWERPSGQPLVTVSNHTSCIDDPLMWGLLPTKVSLREQMRWIPAAKEICFSNKLLSTVFSLGRLVPVIRGDGVYQQGLDFCIKRINEGKWVHVFPEGKVNMTGDNMRLKWGVGRMIAEAKRLPLVLPLWHMGINDILPNGAPYIPRLFKKFTVLVGDPIDFSSLLPPPHSDDGGGGSAAELRKHITSAVQEKLHALKAQAEVLHSEWTASSPVSFRTL